MRTSRISLCNYATVLVALGRRKEARAVLREALAMYEKLDADFANAFSEGEALNFLASLPEAREALLEAGAGRDADGAADYPVVWSGKAQLADIVMRRQRLQRVLADADGSARAKVERLIEVRRDLARLILAPNDPGRARGLKEPRRRKGATRKDAGSSSSSI